MKWKSIDDRYAVSDCGCVANTKTERLLKGTVDSWGYRNVILRQRGKSNHYLIHRLVAQAFIPNPENKPQVNHINGIKTDNRVENLEWVTDGENKTHAVSTGLSNQNGRSNSQWRGGVQMLSLDDDPIKEFETIMVAESWLRENTKWIKASNSNISEACNGKRKQSYGYKWKYVSLD